MPLTIDTTQTRSITNGKLIETGKTLLSQAMLINDATKAWNLALGEVQKKYNL